MQDENPPCCNIACPDRDKKSYCPQDIVGAHVNIKGHVRPDMCYLVPFCQACNKNRKIDYGNGWTRVKPGTQAVSVEKPPQSDGYC